MSNEVSDFVRLASARREEILDAKIEQIMNQMDVGLEAFQIGIKGAEKAMRSLNEIALRRMFYEGMMHQRELSDLEQKEAERIVESQS